MNKNLTNSDIDRQNILNNPFATEEIQKEIGLKGLMFDNKIWFSTEQVAKYFEVTTRTIRNYLEKYEIELKQNGYKVFTDKDLDTAKKAFGSEIDFLTKTTVLGMFDFRSFLNLGMLLSESENAKKLRSIILDTVVGVMNQKLGPNRKYINLNDPLYKNTFENYQGYHKELNVALRECVEMGNTKYPYFNDKIYNFLFLERYKEYKELLNLDPKENATKSHYSEVLTTISTFEVDFAEEITNKAKSLEHKISKAEVDSIFNNLILKRRWHPLLGFARSIIASRDYAFKDVVHPNLEEYKKPCTVDEFKTFTSQIEQSNPIRELEEKSLQLQQTESLFPQIVEDRETYIEMKDK